MSEGTMVPKIKKAIVWDKEHGWCEEELSGLALADGRLRRRAVDSLKRLSDQPTASIPQACGETASMKATYALFKHEEVSHQLLLQPHREQTIKRMSRYDVVLAVQDTSFLNLTRFEKMQDVGPIGTKKQALNGLVMHSTLAVTEQGMSLGVLNQTVWARSEAPPEETEEERKARPIEDKESYKWLRGLEETPKLANTQVVTVCDAEADVFELLALAVASEKGLLLRAGQNRALMPPEVGLVRAAVVGAPICAQVQLDLPAKEREPARQAQVNIHYKRVKLKPPQRAPREDGARLTPLVVWAVLVQEMRPPPGLTAVEWLLVSTIPVQSAENALQRIAWYCQRWQIEIWHRTLKSGCDIERRRLKSAARFGACLALYSIIAWRLHWLTHLARHEPQAPCIHALTEAEWQALMVHATGQTDLPLQPPSIAQAVLWIAQLGGFLARKGDGQPGVTVLWRGWQRLQDLAAMWAIVRPPPAMGKT